MKKQIVFVVGIPDIVSMKVATVLKNRGYETILISLLRNFDIKLYNKAFDKILCFNLDALSISFRNFLDISKKSFEIIKLIKSIRKLNPYVVIAVSAPSPIWLCALTKVLCKKPVIYFPYDVNFLKYRNIESYAIAGTPKIELVSEKYCLESSDGIMFKGDEYRILKNHFKIKCPVIQFLPYCSKENIVPINKNKLSRKDKELHLVYVGYLENKEQKSCWGMKSGVENIEKIINQKVHFHIYTKSQYELILNSEEFSKLLKNKYFHLHKTIPPDRISKEISKYDFGWFIADFDFKIFKKEWISTCTGNKMATFIEAGIPFICYKNNHKFIYKLTKKYGICVGIKKSQIENLKNILSNFNMGRFIKGIEIARKDFEISNNLHKLEKFFEEVKNFHKK